ncbi:XdhC family aldehyde oxidoreductase maturation factor [Desulfosarcina sp.]|uniref:XdhC family aldehyde oxidoreductase maturation factor n=1 Tax=Desulfosarcina sp. TaxID=2027861 RepID=UPI003566A925
MKKIAQTACELLEKGDPFVLATIVSHSGSTPRTSGSKMIVTADGRGVGTIGGGLLEAGAMSRAVELIRLGQSARMSFDLSHDLVDSMDMICGGQAEVLLDCVSPTEMNRAVFNRWRRMLDERDKGSMFIIVMGSGNKVDATVHCLATVDGEIVGDFPLPDMEREKMLSLAADSSTVRTLAFDGGFVVIEPAHRTPTVYLLGAGHVARSTAAMAAMVGFRVSVADDRKEYANRERFRDASEIRVLERFDDAFSGLSVGRDDFIVILTRGHLHDKTVLAQALKTGAGYIGMIGSRRKRDAIYGALLKEGFGQRDIDRVHSPIGLSIGADTPEEIAVSIVAEMIQINKTRPET